MQKKSLQLNAAENSRSRQGHKRAQDSEKMWLLYAELRT